MKIGPYETGRVYQGDCLELMKAIPDGAIDAVVTDPPYGVRGEDWDAMNAHEFARFCMGWLSEAARIGNELLSFGTCGGDLERLIRMLYPDVRQMVWHKPIGSQYHGAHAARRWFTFEPIFHGYTQAHWEVVQPKGRAVAEGIRKAREGAGLSRGGVDMHVRGKKTGLCYRWEEAACLPTMEQVDALRRVMTLDASFLRDLETAYHARDETLEKAAEKAAEKADVLIYRTETSGRHPCEKPVLLMVDLLATLDAQTIMDPFAGSGSTGVACRELGRKFVGFEMDTDYCKLANERIAAARKGITLAEERAGQGTLELFKGRAI